MNASAKSDRLLGSYVFVWGWKYEATVTWFGLVTHVGERTEAVEVLQEMWSGKKPSNTAPKIQSLENMPTDFTKPGTAFKVRAQARDPDDDALTWRWAVFPEKHDHVAGASPPMPPALAGALRTSMADHVTVAAPKKAGIYRLHVWISHGHGHAATANAPFEVK